MRRRIKLSKELRAAIELQNKANEIAKVQSRRPRWMLRAEANQVRRELKRDGMLTTAKRARDEALRQARLTVQRARIAAQKRAGEILAGLSSEEKTTEMGIVIPAGEQIGKLLQNVKQATVSEPARR